MLKREYALEINGTKLIAEFNDLADQTNGSVILRYGDTVILATAVMGEIREEDFFPLSVEYEERFYATGKILGSRFVRREGKPSTDAILTGRIVDRTIRPLFNQKMRHEVQIVLTTLSIGKEDPSMTAVIAASLALGTSDIPWEGPVSAIKMVKENNIDLIACGKNGHINMMEVAAQEISEQEINEILIHASGEIEKIQNWQKQIISEIGKEKIKIITLNPSDETKELFNSTIKPILRESLFENPSSKPKIEFLNKRWLEIFREKMPEGETAIAHYLFEDTVNDLIHEEAIINNKRVDGRSVDEIRPLFAKAGGISKILHGSGIFYRGGTHVFSTLTLGSPTDGLYFENNPEENKHFMHHYNFPPFSTGETGRIGGTNRRMIGHGALAEKALLPVIPEKNTFPYTIRLVSEAFASNGSTSMASVCASTLALMDGGVPIKAPVAGIASGLMMRNKGNNEIEYKILTDIQGPEDHYGDMDFKVAGTRTGITAIQLDVKVEGIPLNILNEAFEKAKNARFHILDVIEKEINTPRKQISENAPEIIVMNIKPDQIGLVIGTGGKTINEIREVTKVDDITIEDDGTVYITGKNGSTQKAKEFIFNMTREYTVGEKMEGEVTKIMDFGAFVKIDSNKEGLVHISEIAPFRVENVETYIKEGMKVPVTIKEIDTKGRINLSIKSHNPEFFSKKEEVPRTKTELKNKS